MQEYRDLSVVVPLYNEEESVPRLVEAVREALREDCSWELVLVDDGSRDRTVEVAAALAAADERVRLVRLARNYGQTPAMQAGFDHARGRIVVSMDGDLQNDPADIPRLVEKLEEGYDLVAGYRVRRQDKVITRKIPSWFANRIIRRITGVQIRDNGCSLKAYRRELLDRIHLYSDMHRFIPAVAAAVAGARIAEVPVRHHARQYGTSKYGLSRVLKVSADLLVISMIRGFRQHPLGLFVAGAALCVLAALVSTSTFLVSFPDFPGIALEPSTDGLVVVSGVVVLWLGCAFFLVALGLIGEVVVRHRAEAARESLPLYVEGNLS